MIAVIFSIILSVVAVVSIAIAVYQEWKKEKTKISFKESMDLVNLPVVTFYNHHDDGYSKLNFLLDTGSDNSYINQSVLINIKYKPIKSPATMMGVEGNIVECTMCAIDIEYKGNYFYNQEFTVSNMDAAFNQVKRMSGVQIHGILGSKFFEKYKYIINFSNLTAYMK